MVVVLRRVLGISCALSLAACALSRDGLGPTFVATDPSEPSEPDESPAEPEEEEDPPSEPPPRDARVPAMPDASAPRPPRTDTSEPMPAPACELAGLHALRLDADLSWQPDYGWNGYAGWSPSVMAGQGALSLLALADVKDGVVTLRACGASLPTVRATTGATVSGTFQDATWDAVSTTWSARVETACGAPGCAVTTDAAEPQLGLDVPPGASWPAATGPVDATMLRDEDGDGLPGLPFVLDAPLTMLGATGYGWVQPVQVTQLMLAMRIGTRLEGRLDSCDEASGEARDLRLDSRVLACELDTGSACLEAQASMLQRSLPSWTVDATRWKLLRLPNGASCEDARAAL